MPSPERDAASGLLSIGLVRQATEPLIFSDEQEEVQDSQSASWFDRIKERLGEDPSVALTRSQERPNGPPYHNDPLPGLDGRRERPGSLPDSPPEVLQREPIQRAVADIHQRTAAIADSVNVIDHQFKIQLLRRVGDLEKSLREVEEKSQRAYEACRGIEGKLQSRKGVPCDVIERLDSMVNFTYAFCKSMEDAGIFQMKRK